MLYQTTDTVITQQYFHKKKNQTAAVLKISSANQLKAFA